MIKMKEIEKRWNERIVPNGWDKNGVSGAHEYLLKYGKNISQEKLQAFYDYAIEVGAEDFARGIAQYLE